MNMNRVFIGGNLTRDPEIKYTPKGTAIASFTVAINRKWKGDDGEEKEEVCFVDCTAWSGRAETIAQYFKKGGAICVEGYLKLEQWEDRQTHEKRSRMKVVVEQFHFVGGKREEGGGGGNDDRRERDRDRTRSSGGGKSSHKSHGHDEYAPANPDADDSDVPF